MGRARFIRGGSWWSFEQADVRFVRQWIESFGIRFMRSIALVMFALLASNGAATR